ncbi:hypothetical protein ENBRE01_3469, partial [Enteropsectra breve]
EMNAVQTIAFRENMAILREIVVSCVFNGKKERFISACAFALSLSSTYFTVKAHVKLAGIKDEFHGNNLKGALQELLPISMLAYVVRYLPKIIYTYSLQRLCRKNFVLCLRNSLSLSYLDFHKKSPGEIRYSTFLQSYASVACCYLAVLETPIILGTSFFSVVNVFKSKNPVFALLFVLVPPAYTTLFVLYIVRKLKYQKELLVEQEKVSSKLYDRLLNYEIIKTFCLEDQQSSAMFEDLHGQKRKQSSLGRFEALGAMVLKISLLLPLAFVLALFVFNFISEGDTGLLPVTLLYGTLSSQLNRLG